MPCCSAEDRHSPESTPTTKLWLGLLAKAAEAGVVFDEGQAGDLLPRRQQWDHDGARSAGKQYDKEEALFSPQNVRKSKRPKMFFFFFFPVHRILASARSITTLSHDA